jgi:2'-5' RNA ligase
VAHALAGVAETLARRARTAGIAPTWVPPANYHVTVAFLGEARPEVVTAVGDRLRAIAVAGRPFRFRAARLGAFAALDRATVVWSGVEESTGELSRLAAVVGDAVAELGFPRDARTYHPHVTLARLRAPTAVGEWLLPLSEQVFGESRCDSLTLFESVATSNGSEYRVVARAPLGTPKSSSERQSDPVQPQPFDASHGTDDGWDRTS